MNERNIDPNLMKYILALLDIPGAVDLGTGSPGAESRTPYSPQSIHTACQIIHFMDEMPGGFFIYHADGNQEIIYANKALQRIFMCDTYEEFQELTGNSFQGIVYPDDLEEVERSIWEQVSHSKYDLDYVEYRIVRKDGSIRWLEDYGHFVRSESLGDIFYVFVGDATEKRHNYLSKHNLLLQENTQKEEELKNLIAKYTNERKQINQEHLRRLEVIEGLSVNYESILYADLDSDEIFAYRLSYRTARQFDEIHQVRSFAWYISDYIETWVHPEDCQQVYQSTSPSYIRKRLAEEKTYYINYRILNKTDTQYIQLRIVNVGNKKHISQIVLGYRRVDDEIRREMEQKQILEEALNSANLAIVAKNSFLSNMSHDMRTPLNAILGYTLLARKYIFDKKDLFHYLEKIEGSSRQLLDLIDKALELSWMESNDVRIVESASNLRTLMQELYKDMFPQALEKNISLSLDFSHTSHYDIYCDSGKLKQILIHLTSNAIKYTKNNGNVDIIVTELEMLPNHYASYQFLVKDTGIGISADFLKHIFEPFEREKNTTFSGIHGTGLGLTIARSLTEMMGGKIKAESTPGEGSTFSFILRFRLQDIPMQPMDNTANTIAQLMNYKILLVEDNEINLEIETEILRGLGFVIETAENGEIAVEKIKHSLPGEYGLILMDIQMPVMDGREATRKIRQLDTPALAHIPIIALSANAFESDRRLSIESGMDAHLAKPLDVPLLLETITRTLQTHKVLFDDTIPLNDGSK